MGMEWARRERQPDRRSIYDLPRMAAYDWRGQMATHVPVLFAAVDATTGPVVEFGTGYNSTPLLHERVAARGRTLLSLEADPKWLGRSADLASPSHELRLVESWEAELERPTWDEPWSVVFVDQSGWEARAATARRVAEAAELVVIHDCDALAREGLLGREEAPLRGPRDRGRRDYGEVFRSWRELFPPEPWPAPTGPPTLLASNLLDVDTIRVDFDVMVPVWWRLARHARRLAPQSVRGRVAGLIGWAHDDRSSSA